jgi:tetratricopeptide (TPR) repeat protein
MSGGTKFLAFSIALVVAVVAYLAVDHLGLMRTSQTAVPAEATAPATASPASPAAVPGPAAGANDETAKKLYEDCVSGMFPTQANAARRAAACSSALQSHQLKPEEIALARLTRGIARTALGDKFLAGEDYAEAVQRYDSLINPNNPDALALYRRAAALNASGQTDKALADYSAAIKADPKASLAFLGRGVLLAARKRSYDRAIEDFDKVLVLEPDNVEALVSRGDAFSQLGDTGRAIADLTRAVALAPDNPIVLLARGQAEGRRHNLAGARRDYDAVLKVDPRNAEALTNLAAVDLLQGKLQDAVRHLDRAIVIQSDNPLAFYNRGYAHFALKEYQPAIADYGEAIRLDPTFGLAYNNRGLSRAILGTDLVQALDDTDQALKLLPLNLDVRETRGFVYLKLGDPALALNEYNAALTLDPNRALSLYGRGLAKIRMGDTAGGKNDEAAALTINPEAAQDFAIYGLQ